MRIKNLPSIESMNGSQDALVIEQTDGSEDKSRKVSPAQLKQYVQTGDFEATGEVKDGHGNILKDMAKSADVATALAGKQDTLTFDNAPTQNSNNPVKSGGIFSAIETSALKVANVSATMTVSTADVTAIGGYRSVSSTSKVLSTFTGYPTGKTVVAESLYAWGANAAILGVVHVINGTVYLNTAATGDYTVHGVVFYKD